MNFHQEEKYEDETIEDVCEENFSNPTRNNPET